jgi:hypothetical protein
MKTFLLLVLLAFAGKNSAQWCNTFYDDEGFNTNFAYYHFDDSLLLYFDSTEFIYSNSAGNIQYPINIDTSNVGVWQVGKPQKGTGFDSAYSLNKTIITDTVNPYPTNNLSYFDIKTVQYINTSIRFKYKIDTDTLMDGFYMTISTDNGINWLNYFDYTTWASPSSGNVERYCLPALDTLVNGELGISGTNFDWESIEIYEVFYGVKQQTDTIIFRFNFVSDSIDTGKKGMMIDNIETFTTFIPGTVDERIDREIKIYPNPSQNYVTLDLMGFKGDFKDSYASIIDLNGRIIRKIKILDKTLTIQLGDISNGVYLITVRDQNKSFMSEKLVINR